MSTHENTSVVRRFNDEVISQGKLDAVDDLMAPAFVDRSPFPGLSADREGVKMLFGGLRRAFPDLTATVHDQVAEGDKVATRKTLAGTHRGDLWGIPATGRQVAFGVIDILRVVDGKMVEHWTVVDQLGLMQQLGVIPAPEGAGE